MNRQRLSFTLQKASSLLGTDPSNFYYTQKNCWHLRCFSKSTSCDQLLQKAYYIEDYTRWCEVLNLFASGQNNILLMSEASYVVFKDSLLTGRHCRCHQRFRGLRKHCDQQRILRLDTKIQIFKQLCSFLFK